MLTLLDNPLNSVILNVGQCTAGPEPHWDLNWQMLFLAVGLPSGLEIVQVDMLLSLVKDFVVWTLLVKLQEMVETSDLSGSVEYTWKTQPSRQLGRFFKILNSRRFTYP